MSVHPVVTQPAAQTMPAPARVFIPLHKRCRRTATSVCAGYFDEVASPRGGVPRLTGLSGVGNVDWLRAAREEQIRQGLLVPESYFALAPDESVVGVPGHPKPKRTGRSAAAYADDSADEHSPSPDDADDGDYVDRDSDYHEPAHELSRTRGWSLSSATTSLTSARPRTPIDFDVASPAMVISPTSPSTAYPNYAPVLPRRQTTGDLVYASYGKSGGKARGRARSSSTEPDLPLAKRPKLKLQRVNSVPSASAVAHTASQSIGSQPTVSPSPSVPKPRAHKPAARKGWKGWVTVEAVPEPPTLIKLDAPAPILPERRTRSGKNFDAIGVGNGDWINPS